MASAAAATSRNKCLCSHPRVRNAHTERRALKQMFEPKCKRMYKFKCNNPCEIPYCGMETGRGEVAHSRRWTAALTTHAQHKGTAKTTLACMTDQGDDMTKKDQRVSQDVHRKLCPKKALFRKLLKKLCSAKCQNSTCDNEDVHVHGFARTTTTSTTLRFCERAIS